MEDRDSPMVQAVASTPETTQTSCALAMLSKVNGCGRHIDLSLIGGPIDGIVDLIMECLRDRMFEPDQPGIWPQPSYCCRLHPVPGRCPYKTTRRAHACAHVQCVQRFFPYLFFSADGRAMLLFIENDVSSRVSNRQGGGFNHGSMAPSGQENRRRGPV
jgi:hypothetical protein